MHDDFGKVRKGWLQVMPNPDRQAFAGGVLQPFDFVQVAVVQLIEDRPKRCFDIGKVHAPPGMFTEIAGDADFDAKRVTVQSRTLVPLRNIWQPVRGFDRENLEDVHSTILLRHATTRSSRTGSYVEVAHLSAKTWLNQARKSTQRFNIALLLTCPVFSDHGLVEDGSRTTYSHRHASDR